VQPTPSAMFPLLIPRLRIWEIIPSTDFLAPNNFPSELTHSPGEWTRVNLVHDRLGRILPQYFVKTWRSVILCGYDYRTFFYEKLRELVACDPLGPNLVINSGPPEVLPMPFQLFNEFLPYDDVICVIPP